MKIKLKILLTLILVLSVTLVYAVEQHPSQYTPVKNFNRFEKSGRDYGWVEQASGFADPSRGIHYMFAVNEDTVWATAYDGSGSNDPVHEYTKTVNGGEDWIPGEIDVPDPNLEPAMVFAFNALEAWCPMYHSTGTPDDQGIYHTSDGGANWSRIGGPTMYTQTGAFPNVVHFFDENNGFAQGDPVDDYYELYTTTDGGTNWTRVPSRDIPDPLTGEFGVVGYYDVVGDTIWWGTNKGRVYKSTDKGYTWSVCDQIGSLTYVNIWFKDSMNGILQDKGASTNGTLYETSDGGINWTLIDTTGRVFYNDISYVPGTSNMYVSTGADYQNNASGASYSTDGGHTWVIYSGTYGNQFLATDWDNDLCGYAGAFNQDQYTGGMYKYTYISAPVLPPDSLTAEALPDLTVQLRWCPPPSGMSGWIRWDNGTNAGSIGLINPGQWDVASRFSATHMMPYSGGTITKVKFYPTSTTATYAIRIWSGPNASLVTEEPVPSPTIDDWNEITLTSPVAIVDGEQYWIGYHINQVEAGDYPAGHDPGPSLNGLWANIGTWTDISPNNFDYNWNIAGYVDNSDGKLAEMNKNSSRDLTGYNVYHSNQTGGPYDFVASVPDTDTSFIHTDPITGATNYYVVTAVYGLDESDYSNEASAYVEIATAEELYYDDGTAESGYCSGNPLDNLAVRITPNTYPVRLMRIKYYMTNVDQQMVVRVWDDNGPDGEPGTQLVDPPYTVSASELNENDWSIVTLPEDTYNIVITEGDFYVGWTETGGNNLIGIDENGPIYNRSWQYTSDEWWDYTMGVPQNMMMRAVVNTEVGVDDPEIPENTSYVSVYPNPVNNSTEFKYNIRNSNAKKVEIGIYNILGQKVDSVIGENGSAKWIPEDLPNGIYFYKVKSGDFKKTNKLLLLR